MNEHVWAFIDALNLARYIYDTQGWSAMTPCQQVMFSACKTIVTV